MVKTAEGFIEMAYLLDTITGTVYRSIVKDMPTVTGGGGTSGSYSFVSTEAPNYSTRAIVTPAISTDGGSGTVSPPALLTPTATASKDPAGDIMTVEERQEQLKKQRKVPPAFLGGIDRMGLDPAKNANGITDVTPHL